MGRPLNGEIVELTRRHLGESNRSVGWLNPSLVQVEGDWWPCLFRKRMRKRIRVGRRIRLWLSQDFVPNVEVNADLLNILLDRWFLTLGAGRGKKKTLSRMSSNWLVDWLIGGKWMKRVDRTSEIQTFSFQPPQQLTAVGYWNQERTISIARWCASALERKEGEENLDANGWEQIWSECVPRKEEDTQKIKRGGERRGEQEDNLKHTSGWKKMTQTVIQLEI